MRLFYSFTARCLQLVLLLTWVSLCLGRSGSKTTDDGSNNRYTGKATQDPEHIPPKQVDVPPKQDLTLSFLAVIAPFLAIIMFCWLMEVLKIGEVWIEKCSESAYKAFIREDMVQKLLRVEMAEKIGVAVPSKSKHRKNGSEVGAFDFDMDVGIRIPKMGKKKVAASFPPAWILQRKRYLYSTISENQVLMKWHHDLQLKKKPADSLLHRIFPWLDDEFHGVFDSGMFKRIDEGNSFMGCEGVLYPNGLKLNMILFTWVFPKGCFEDFVFTLANNHSIIQMFLTTKGHPYSRFNRKVSYFFLTAVLFILSFMIEKGIPNKITANFVKVSLLVPLLNYGALFFKLILTCPCFQKKAGDETPKSCFANCCIMLGEGFGSFGGIAGGVGIIFAATKQIIDSGVNIKEPLMNFFVLIVLVNSIVDTVALALKFSGSKSIDFLAFDEAKAKKNLYCCYICYFYCCCGCCIEACFTHSDEMEGAMSAAKDAGGVRFTCGQWLDNWIAVYGWEKDKDYSETNCAFCCCFLVTRTRRMKPELSQKWNLLYEHRRAQEAQFLQQHGTNLGGHYGGSKKQGIQMISVNGTLDYQQDNPMRKSFPSSNCEYLYTDKAGVVQGPYSSSAMRSWYKAGYFTAHMMIKPTHFSNYYALSNLFPALDQAFTFVPTEPGIYSPPENRSTSSPVSSDRISYLSQNGAMDYQQDNPMRKSFPSSNCEYLYTDKAGVVQGPYSSSAMRSWYKAGYFTAHMMIKPTHFSNYYALSNLFPALDQAFTFVPTEPGIYSPPENRSTSSPVSSDRLSRLSQDQRDSIPSMYLEDGQQFSEDKSHYEGYSLGRIRTSGSGRLAEEIGYEHDRGRRSEGRGKSVHPALRSPDQRPSNPKRDPTHSQGVYRLDPRGPPAYSMKR